jgi:hypothetical protein
MKGRGGCTRRRRRAPKNSWRSVRRRLLGRRRRRRSRTRGKEKRRKRQSRGGRRGKPPGSGTVWRLQQTWMLIRSDPAMPQAQVTSVSNWTSNNVFYLKNEVRFYKVFYYFFEIQTEFPKNPGEIRFRQTAGPRNGGYHRTPRTGLVDRETSPKRGYITELIIMYLF